MILKIKSKIRNILDILFLILAKITKTNLIYLAYYQKGILRYGDDEITGEKYVVEKILKEYLGEKDLIFFDVGAYDGKYSLFLNKNFPQAKIYSLEPNPQTYNKIIKEDIHKNIQFLNIGLGNKKEKKIIYDYKDSNGTQHASQYKEVFTEIYKIKDNLKEATYENDTLDDFCNKNKIEKIDFLKIDTEGNEYSVLIGGKKLIDEAKIKIIQFEFNEMNVVSKIFLKDFYDLLNNYNLYRITKNKLIPLPVYKTENEIFKYQNILAINKKIR